MRSCLFMSFAMMLLQTVPAAGQTPLYGQLEISINNANSYSNPFDMNEIELVGTFTRPGGGDVVVSGFYDGDGSGGQAGNVWKVRFMPSEEGEWSYSLSWGGSGTPGLADSGTFIVVGSTKHGLLKQNSSNPRYFEHMDGTDFYPRIYYLSQLFTPDSDVLWKTNGTDLYFGGFYDFNLAITTFWQGDNIVANGWNAWTDTYQPGSVTFNSLGTYPVNGCASTGCSAGQSHDRLDLASWHTLETRLVDLEAKGVIWHDFDGIFPNVAGALHQRPQPEQETFVRNYIARLAAYWNVVWQLCFECDEFLTDSQVGMWLQFVERHDPYDHMITVHDRSIATDFPETDATAVQDTRGEISNSKRNYDTVTSAFNSRNKPVICMECSWEGPADNKLDGNGIRTGAWGVALGGAAYNYAEQFAQSNPSDFRYGDGAGFPYVEIMHDFLETLPYFEMSPGPGLVSGNAGAIAFAKPGSDYVVQLQNGGTVNVDLTAANQALAVSWLDPRLGTLIENDPVEIDGGSVMQFSAPDTRDWVLVIRAPEPHAVPSVLAALATLWLCYQRRTCESKARSL